MNTRQRCILGFLKASGRCSKIKLAKIFFLMDREGRLDAGFKFYKFVPYKFGPYSFEMFHDVEGLERDNMLETDDVSARYISGDERISPEIGNVLESYRAEYAGWDESRLIDHVYSRFPEYTVFSQIGPRQTYIRDLTGALTVGYEGQSIDEFIMRLITEKVHVLADVRNNPWSMKYGFTAKTLGALCGKVGIEYLNFPQLGIPGGARRDLRTAQDYARLFEQFRPAIASQTAALGQIASMARDRRVAIMCFEQNPDNCHRRIVGEEVRRLGAKVEFG